MRALAVLLRHGGEPGAEEASDESAAVLREARNMLADESAEPFAEKSVAGGRLTGEERAFVADKPVASPQSFDVALQAGRNLILGRSDPADATHVVDVDMSDVSSAPSVSRTHVLLRHHDSRKCWQIRVAGRNGIYDDAGKFFPPNDDWIDLSVFPNNRFEVCWVKFEVIPE